MTDRIRSKQTVTPPVSTDEPAAAPPKRAPRAKAAGTNKATGASSKRPPEQAAAPSARTTTTEKPRATEQRRPTEEAAAAHSASGFEAAGAAVAHVVDFVTKPSMEKVGAAVGAGVKVVKENPGKAVAAATVATIGVTQSLVLTGLAATVGTYVAGVRVAEHWLGDGKPLSESLDLTAKEAVEMRQAVADEAKAVVNVFKGWLRGKKSE